VSWQHPSNLPASSGLETQHRLPSFLLSPDGRTTHGVVLLPLEARQNSRNGLPRPTPCLECCPGRRPMSPRSAQHEAILYIPGPPSASRPAGIIAIARCSFLREAFGLRCVDGLGNPYLPRTREPSFLAAHETQSPPCYSIIVVSLVPQHLARYRTVPVHQCTLFPWFFLLPSPPPLYPPKKQQCVVAASSAHQCRAQIAQLTARLQIGILRLHHVTLPQLSLTRLQNKAREPGCPSASAETPAQFHPNEHRLRTRNTPAESQRPGSPNSPCVSISCFLTCTHPRRVCRKPFEPSH
jgi:hypothetical protein